MKKLTTILTALVLFFGTQSFTPAIPVTAAVQQSFTRHFGAVTTVVWEKTGDYYFATFTVKDQETTAAYDETGELIGTSRRIAIASLPVSVSTELNEKYAGYSFSAEAIEIDYSGEVLYYFTAQNETKFLKLKATSEGSVSVIEKIRKVL